MANHGRPTLNIFDVIKHHPRVFQVIPKLYPFDQIKSITIPSDQHFEKINFLIRLLPKKTIVLNVIIRIQGLEHEDGIKGVHVPHVMFEQ